MFSVLCYHPSSQQIRDMALKKLIVFHERWVAQHIRGQWIEWIFPVVVAGITDRVSSAPAGGGETESSDVLAELLFSLAAFHPLPSHVPAKDTQGHTVCVIVKL